MVIYGNNAPVCNMYKMDSVKQANETLNIQIVVINNIDKTKNDAVDKLP